MSLGGSEFGFMSSDVSSEKPKGVMVERVAASIRRGRQGGGAVLAVCGPAVVHTGAAPALAAMVKEGWIQVLFAGNGFATHDIEASVLGTSLGISAQRGRAQPSTVTPTTSGLSTTCDVSAPSRLRWRRAG